MVSERDYRGAAEFNENDPNVKILLLAQRVDTLAREKEELEGDMRSQAIRIAKMETTFNRGAGILIILPILGTVLGFLLAYGKVLFRPWTNGQ